LTGRCASSAKPGGAAADNEDIGRYLPLHYYLTILSTAGSMISVLNAAVVQQAKSIFLRMRGLLLAPFWLSAVARARAIAVRPELAQG
jgi:hypothetical protein